MGLPLKIAWRYLMSKKGHQAVNIISIVAVCGVVVSTAALICVLSVFNGFRGLIMGKLAMLDPQVAVTATLGKTVNDADSVIQVIQAIIIFFMAAEQGMILRFRTWRARRHPRHEEVISA